VVRKQSSPINVPDCRLGGFDRSEGRILCPTINLAGSRGGIYSFDPVSLNETSFWNVNSDWVPLAMYDTPNSGLATTSLLFTPFSSTPSNNNFFPLYQANPYSGSFKLVVNITGRGPVGNFRILARHPNQNLIFTAREPGQGRGLLIETINFDTRVASLLLKLPTGQLSCAETAGIYLPLGDSIVSITGGNITRLSLRDGSCRVVGSLPVGLAPRQKYWLAPVVAERASNKIYAILATATAPYRALVTVDAMAQRVASVKPIALAQLPGTNKRVKRVTISGIVIVP